MKEMLSIAYCMDLLWQHPISLIFDNHKIKTKNENRMLYSNFSCKI